jgi:putative ABC transport system permease protein
MIKNYIKIALRNIDRQKIYSLITLSGLIVGLSVFTMFALLTDLVSHSDSFHKNMDRIFAVVQVVPGGRSGDRHAAISPPPLLPALMGEYPEIERGARYFPAGRMIVRHQDKVFYEHGVKFVDADFLSIFSFEMIRGEKTSVLSRANSIVLTEDSAFKYFGSENPVGKTLSLDNRTDVVVTGITENPPDNSTIRYDFLVSMGTARMLYDWEGDWNTNNQAVFLLLSQETESVALEGKLSSFIGKYFPDNPQTPLRLYLHPLSEFSLGSEDIDCYWSTSHISYISIWIIAVLLLIIASINFMNLSTARYVTRAQEVGIRKVVGASRRQMIKQFLGESILLALISLPVAVILYELCRPLIGAYLGSVFDISVMGSPHVLILIFGVAVLTGLFAGSYPAFYLSAFKPVQIFNRRLVTGKKGSRFRQILVVVQFTFAIILILMTVISIKQSRHNLKVDLGFDRSNILAVSLSEGARGKLEILKNELVLHKDIVSVSAASALPIEWNTEREVLPEGFAEEEAFSMNAYGVDYGFIEMLDLDLFQGRSFSPEYADTENFVINETAARQLQWMDPVGKQLTLGDRKGTVIGVARDFHFKTLFLDKISPTVLYLEPERLNYMLVEYLSADNLAGVTEYIKERWSIAVPEIPFESTTLEAAFFDVFQGDQTAEMTGILGALAVFLSCLGLFGLSSFSVERRIKEIGIRKVLGASSAGIVRMLTRDFIKLVAIANIIGLPLAYFMMRAITRFVYSYPVGLGPGIFVLTAVLTLLLAFLTVSSQTLKSATANPVDSLKYE